MLTVSNNEKPYFKNLDSIRFIAALMVYLNHGVYPSFKYLPVQNTFWEKLLSAISNGGTGVSIFFVLIGSVLFRLLNSNDEIVLYFHTFSVLLDLGIGGLIAYLIKESKKIRNFFENSTTAIHAVLFILSFCLVFWSDSLFSFKYGNAIG